MRAGIVSPAVGPNIRSDGADADNILYTGFQSFAMKVGFFRELGRLDMRCDEDALDIALFQPIRCDSGQLISSTSTPGSFASSFAVSLLAERDKAKIR